MHSARVPVSVPCILYTVSSVATGTAARARRDMHARKSILIVACLQRAIIGMAFSMHEILEREGMLGHFSAEIWLAARPYMAVLCSVLGGKHRR